MSIFKCVCVGLFFFIAICFYIERRVEAHRLRKKVEYLVTVFDNMLPYLQKLTIKVTSND